MSGKEKGRAHLVPAMGWMGLLYFYAELLLDEEDFAYVVGSPPPTPPAPEKMRRRLAMPFDEYGDYNEPGDGKTVGELIVILQKFDPNAPICVTWESIFREIDEELIYTSADGVVLIDADDGSYKEEFQKSVLTTGGSDSG